MREVFYDRVAAGFSNIISDFRAAAREKIHTVTRAGKLDEESSDITAPINYRQLFD
jgi:hypothetical protein